MNAAKDERKDSCQGAGGCNQSGDLIGVATAHTANLMLVRICHSYNMSWISIVLDFLPPSQDAALSLENGLCDESKVVRECLLFGREVEALLKRRARRLSDVQGSDVCFSCSHSKIHFQKSAASKKSGPRKRVPKMVWLQGHCSTLCPWALMKM